VEPKLFCKVNVVWTNVVPSHILGCIVDLQAVDVSELPICPNDSYSILIEENKFNSITPAM
jgi:hypothetical protein